MEIISYNKKYPYNYLLIFKNGTKYELENYPKSFYLSLVSSDRFEVDHQSMRIRQK